MSKGSEHANDLLDAELARARTEEDAWGEIWASLVPFDSAHLPDDRREADMVVLQRDSAGCPTVWCDPGVVDLVTALNAAGLRTIWSCDGHGHRPAVVGLRDGRQLLVLESIEALQQIASLWPDINGEWRTP